MSDNWAVSAQNWHQVKAPLRPAKGELSLITHYMEQLAESTGLEQALVMGTTPEYFHLPWPANTRVCAVDSSPAMLGKVWPGPPNTAIRGNWLDLPLAGCSQDMVLLDAGLCLLSWPDEQARVMHEIARVLKPGGVWIIRLLVLPRNPQTPEQVYQAVRDGSIENLSYLRVHLWMALQAQNGRAATNQDIWGGLKKAFGSWTALATLMNCHADYLYLHRFAEIRLTQAWPVFEFATLEDYEKLLCTPLTGFTCEARFHPEYAMGDRCPTLVLRKA